MDVPTSRFIRAKIGDRVIMRGASFHLQAVTIPAASVAHNRRAWSDDHPPPRYLLPEELSLGHWSVIEGDVEAAHAEKMTLASGRARATKNYSPLWEGVLNLDHPTGDGDHARFTKQVKLFCDGYERITGHRVISAEVHLDEGRVENDRVAYNAHAHITVDRTNDRGRVIELKTPALKKIQTLAAEATGLARGEDATETRREHLSHGAYRAMATRGEVASLDDREREAEEVASLRASVADAVNRRRAAEAALREARAEAQKLARERDRALERETEGLKANERLEAEKTALAASIPNVVETATLYGELRGVMKASGLAKQTDYQEAKKRAEDRAWIEEQTKLWLARLDAKRTAEAVAATPAPSPPPPLVDDQAEKDQAERLVAVWRTADAAVRAWPTEKYPADPNFTNQAILDGAAKQPPSRPEARTATEIFGDEQQAARKRWATAEAEAGAGFLGRRTAAQQTELARIATEVAAWGVGPQADGRTTRGQTAAAEIAETEKKSQANWDGWRLARDRAQAALDALREAAKRAAEAVARNPRAAALARAMGLRVPGVPPRDPNDPNGGPGGGKTALTPTPAPRPKSKRGGVEL